MATFYNNGKPIHNDYMTPKYAWSNIKEYIPKNKVIWEPFYGDGKSGEYLTELGFEVIHKDIDFFENNLGDIIVSNPPFSDVKKVLERLKVIDKPFILILPVSKIATQYFKEWANKIQILIPSKRIHFIKNINGQIPEGWKNGCNFDCFYYCYKMNLSKDILFLT
jgi:hypothetical protein